MTSADRQIDGSGKRLTRRLARTRQKELTSCSSCSQGVVSVLTRTAEPQAGQAAAGSAARNSFRGRGLGKGRESTSPHVGVGEHYRGRATGGGADARIRGKTPPTTKGSSKCSTWNRSTTPKIRAATLGVRGPTFKFRVVACRTPRLSLRRLGVNRLETRVVRTT